MADRSDLTDALARFTPDRGGLDRDAIVFAAGQQSARSHGWRNLALGLIAAQAVTLLALWPSTRPTAEVKEIAPSPTTLEEPADPPSPAPSDSWLAVVRALRDGDEAISVPFVQRELTPTNAALTPCSGPRFD